MATTKGKYGFSTSGFTAPTADHAAGIPEVDTSLVARNPLNTRVITPTSPQVIKMKDSIEQLGQLESVTVVTRAAFLAIFPEFEEKAGEAVLPEYEKKTIGPGAVYVEVTGGQRWMACHLLGRSIRFAVNDALAADRAGFVAATAEENMRRDSLDALELAEAVAQLVKECGNNQSEAGRRWGRSQPWVHHQLNLRKLAPEVQELLRAKAVPSREVRGTLHQLPPAEQLAVVRRLIAGKEAAITAVMAEPGEGAAADPVPQQRERVPRIVAAVRRLSKTSPAALGVAMRAELPREYRQIVAEELLRED